MRLFELRDAGGVWLVVVAVCLHKRFTFKMKKKRLIQKGVKRRKKQISR